MKKQSEKKCSSDEPTSFVADAYAQLSANDKMYMSMVVGGLVLGIAVAHYWLKN